MIGEEETVRSVQIGCVPRKQTPWDAALESPPVSGVAGDVSPCRERVEISRPMNRSRFLLPPLLALWLVVLCGCASFRPDREAVSMPGGTAQVQDTLYFGMSKKEGLEQAKRMFQHVGVPEEFLNRYAFELSGGMRQRSAIAMALVTSPELIILDEPTSALDVLTQANIFNVLKRLKRELEISYILITHDIATSSELADKVAVMYAGQIVEVSGATEFFLEPLHPYSKMLMDSVPRLRGVKEPDFITGQPPSLLNPPTGCRFRERCPRRFEMCGEEPPVFEQDDRLVKCWLYR